MSDEQPAEGDGEAGPEGSVALAIERYRQGDDSELSRMVFAFHTQLLARAQRKLKQAPNLQARTDAEVAVSSGMRSFLSAAKAGRFPHLGHRNELLGLLVTIVQRKVSGQIRAHSTLKSGSGKTLGEREDGLEVRGRELSPLEAALEKEAVTDAEAVIRRWHDHMDQKNLLEPAMLVLEGHGHRAIAERLRCTESKARRLVTTVHKLTESFGLEEVPEE
jgi:hypothetical protein